MAENKTNKLVYKIFNTEFDMTNEHEAKNFYFYMDCLAQIESAKGTNWQKFVEENVVFGA